MRAREPERCGHVERDGVRTWYEAFGDGEHALVFLSDIIVTGRMWKAQVGYLARHHRVVVVDPRGNGRSDKPTEEKAYADTEMVADVVAVLDELGIDRAVAVGLCESGYYALLMAATVPDRVEGVVAIGSWASDGTPRVDRGTHVYDDLLACWNAPDTGQQGWSQLNREVWLHDWPRWPRFFFGEIVNEPHSTKIYEDLVAWACQSNGPAQVAAGWAPTTAETPEATAALLAQVRCPVLMIHGTHDFCQPFARGAHVARMTGGELLALSGAGHLPTARDPVTVNHAIADFVARVHAGAVAVRPEGPALVRLHLSTRWDPAPPLPGGRRLGRGTAYGEGPPAAVVLPATGDTKDAWTGQLPGLARRLPLLALNTDLTGTADVRAALAAAGVRDAVLFAPPGTARWAADLAADRQHLSALVRVEAPRALGAQPGLLESFVHRLPRTDPASVVRAMGDAAAADAAGRAVVVEVVDRRPRVRAGVDVVVTVEGGVIAAEQPPPARRRRRRPRVLYLSSPIGLGHVRRDLAIADALRREVPGLQVDWLSQSPVTDFLTRRGERVHPASAWLASESSHIESEAGEHDLHAFSAIRRMDEILVHNFHVFDDLVAEREYDAWVGDEAWDLDHFLHENPRLKRAPFVWLTDFVGWIPMRDGGEREAELTADYNAE
ncbi:MAG TPA: alpha/beta fold hydrolase, partial [Marmoricola sp.]|nr:alpha/beta fold hydrolase [Marmoricola sp.]